MSSHLELLFNKKGITPIIAVILLLMMTIAIAGLAYTWIQKLQQTSATNVENSTAALSSSLRVSLRVEGYNITCTQSAGQHIRIYGKNAGTEVANNLQLYVDDIFIPDASNITLNPGTTTSWLLSNQTSIGGVGGAQTCANWINKTRKISILSDESGAEGTFTFICSAGVC